MFQSLTRHWRDVQQTYRRISQRNSQWMTMLKNGGGLVSDYIKADFGTDAPNGLDIKPWDDHQIAIQGINEGETYKTYTKEEQKKALQNTRAWVPFNEDDIIEVNPNTVNAFSMRVQAVKKILEGERPILDTSVFGHEFIHTRQHHILKTGWARPHDEATEEYTGHMERSRLSRAWRNFSRTLINRKNNEYYSISDYYAQNNEMQARLHEVLALGYNKWQTMPTSKIELWAALHNFGIKTPPSVMDALKSDEGKAARQKFSIYSGIKNMAANETQSFNNIQKYIGYKDVQAGMWENQYPLLYGELLEFYGDIPGRARVDQGTNPRPAIEAMDTIKNAGESLHKAEIRDIAEALPPALAAPFINNITINTNNDFLAYDNGVRVIDELLQRPEIRRALFGPETMYHNPHTGLDGRSPLYVAAIEGNADITAMLLEAGANPWQKTTHIDIRGAHQYAIAAAHIKDQIRSIEESLYNMPNVPNNDYNTDEDHDTRQDMCKYLQVL